VVLCRNHSQTVLFKFSNRYSSLDCLYILGAPLVFISEPQTVPCRKLKNFSKKRGESKQNIWTRIHVRPHSCVYAQNWPFGAWASWKRGQSPYQFPAERRPLQKSLGGGLNWLRRRPITEKISIFFLAVWHRTPNTRLGMRSPSSNAISYLLLHYFDQNVPTEKL